MNWRFSCLVSAIMLYSLKSLQAEVQIRAFDMDQYNNAENNDIYRRSDSLYLLRDTSIKKKVIEIGEVNIFRRFNPIKLTAGKLTYEVSKTALHSSGNALEVLRKMPGVTIMPNGKISLNGQEGVQFLIDGKTSFLTGENLITYLSAMPASSIDIVELITQPDATLDAGGDARIINLKRNTKASNGIRVIISSQVEQGKYNRMQHHIMAETTIKKVSLSNSYSYSKGRDLVDITSSRYLDHDTKESIKDLQLDMDAIRKKDYMNHYYNSTLDYSPTKHVNTGAYVLLNNNRRVKDEEVNSVFLYHKVQPDSVINTSNLLHHNFRNFSTGAFLIANIDKDSKWENYFDRQDFRQSDQQVQWSDKLLVDNFKSEKQELVGHTDVQVKITTMQSKYQFNIISNLVSTFGGKYTRVNMRTKSLYDVYRNNQWQAEKQLSNGFGHGEKLKSLFFQLQYQTSEVFTLDMGLRYEHATFNSLATNDTDTHDDQLRSYKNFFPNMTMTYSMSTQQKLSLHYNRRVNRPNFRDLNPFVEVNDPYLYEKGNPDLKPEFVNNMELTWVFKNTYSLQFSYTLKQDPISKSYNLDHNNRTVVMPLNLDHASGFGLRFNATTISPMRSWNIQANANLMYKNFEWITKDKVFHNRRLTPAIQLQNQFNLPSKVNLEINCFFNGATAEGQAYIAHLWSINTGLRKTFFQDKFTLYIYANDLFRSNRPNITFNGDVMNGKYRESYDSRAFGINLSYRLNKGGKTDPKNNNIGNRLEENNRISY